MPKLRQAALVVLAVVVPGALAYGDTGHSAIPKFGGDGIAWGINFWDYILDPPPGSGHGPIKTDPRYPYNSQIQNGGRFRGGEFTVGIAYTRDPILCAWEG